MVCVSSLVGEVTGSTHNGSGVATGHGVVSRSVVSSEYAGADKATALRYTSMMESDTTITIVIIRILRIDLRFSSHQMPLKSPMESQTLKVFIKILF